MSISVIPSFVCVSIYKRLFSTISLLLIDLSAQRYNFIPKVYQNATRFNYFYDTAVCYFLTLLFADIIVMTIRTLLYKNHNDFNIN